MAEEIQGGDGKRGFVCGRFPTYSIGSGRDEVNFKDGFFATDNPEQIALIESNSWYGVFIHPRETQEQIDAMRGGAPVESEISLEAEAEEIQVEGSEPAAEEIDVPEENPASGKSRARKGQGHSKNVVG